MDAMQTDSHQAQTGKSLDSQKMWVMILIALLAVAAGFALWQTIQLGGASSSLQSYQISTGDLQASKIALQKELDELKNDESAAATANTGKDKILAAVDAYVRAPKQATSQQFEYAITKTTDQFAKVSVGVAEGGGYSVTLKRVGENWTVIVAGQDAPSQETVDKYGIPSDL